MPLHQAKWVLSAMQLIVGEVKVLSLSAIVAPLSWLCSSVTLQLKYSLTKLISCVFSLSEAILVVKCDDV